MYIGRPTNGSQIDGEGAKEQPRHVQMALSVCFLSFPFMHDQVIKGNDQREGVELGALGCKWQEIGSAAQLHIEETFFSEVLIGSSEV